MLVSDFIGDIRTALRQHSDDSRFTDQYIYSLGTKYRAVLIERKLTKRQKIAPESFQATPCLELVWETVDDCPCITAKCKYLRSSQSLPEQIVGRNSLPLQVRDPMGNLIPSTTWGELTRSASRRVQNKRAYFIQDNRIIVTGGPGLKYIVARGLFRDPLAVEDLLDCNDTTGSSACYDPLAKDFRIDASLYPAAIDMTVKGMLSSFMVTEDLVNNAKDDTKGLPSSSQGHQKGSS